jgi:hypothetical protein
MTCPERGGAFAGVSFSNSMPAYRSSVFSRTITRSMSSYFERTPS